LSEVETRLSISLDTKCLDMDNMLQLQHPDSIPWHDTVTHKCFGKVLKGSITFVGTEFNDGFLSQDN
jgi:hypothetical protein